VTGILAQALLISFTSENVPGKRGGKMNDSAKTSRTNYVMKLRVFRGGQILETKYFTRKLVVIGRDPIADLMLPSRFISRSHALLRLDGDRVLVEDLGSINGTKIKGERISQASLREQEMVSIGDFDLEIELLARKQQWLDAHCKPQYQPPTNAQVSKQKCLTPVAKIGLKRRTTDVYPPKQPVAEERRLLLEDQTDPEARPLGPLGK